MKSKVLEKKWVQEVLILVASFILVTLNGWRGIKNIETGLQALLYFAILYLHVIVHRFALLPILFKKKYVLYITCSILLILIFSGILYVTGVNWIYTWVEILKVNEFEVFLYHVGTCILSLIAILGTFILLQFYRDQKKQASLQLSINEMELKVLHSQLNPHFLFNTFNNLYGISLNEPSRVPEFVLEVSNLMRYHIESYSLNRAKLEDELAFIESYIVLEEERVGERCQVKYNYTNHSKALQFELPPLLLIPFIENAFKHSSTADENSFVSITIEVQASLLAMSVVNSIPKLKSNYSKSTGLGLKNIKQRLELLYDDKYSLDINTTPTQYNVKLLLPLVNPQETKGG